MLEKNVPNTDPKVCGMTSKLSYATYFHVKKWIEFPLNKYLSPEILFEATLKQPLPMLPYSHQLSYSHQLNMSPEQSSYSDILLDC